MKNKILSNISYNLLIKVITYLFSAVTLAYVARILRPESFGRISFASSFVSYFVMLANLGIPIYAMRTCAELRDDRKGLSKAFNELWSINILLSFVSAIFLLVAIFLIPRLRENTQLMLVYGSSIFFQMIGCEWLYKGLERFSFLAGINLFCKTLSFFLIILFVHSEEQEILYAVLSVLTSYGSSLICFLFLHRYVDISFNIRINKGHFKPIFVFFLMSCAVYVYSSLDLTMLGFMKGDYETGLYTIASKGKTVLTITGNLVWSSALPIASNLWKAGNRKKFESIARKAIVAVCGVQFLVTLGCFFIARWIILIIGGKEYLDAVPAFRVLLLSLVPIGASNILGGVVLIPSGRENRLLRAEVYGAIFNFLANFLLIPYLSILGAAITTFISEVIVWGVCLYHVRKELDLDLGLDVVMMCWIWASDKIRVGCAKLISKIMKDKLQYYCPCCDTRLIRFADGGYIRRPMMFDIDRYKGIDQNVVCPVCGSVSRHRILASWLDKNIDLVKGKKILYFAQEKSIRMWFDRNKVTVTTADLYLEADLKINIEDTGLEAASYDVVICNHVLEHVDDFRKALKELYRILTLGGSLICSFPMDPKVELLDEDPSVQTTKEMIRRFGQYDHRRVFGMKAEVFLEDAGFTVVKIDGSDYPEEILPGVGPADYDMNVLFWGKK